MFVGFKCRPHLSSCIGICLVWDSQTSNEECDLCKAARLLSSKGSVLASSSSSCGTRQHATQLYVLLLWRPTMSEPGPGQSGSDTFALGLACHSAAEAWLWLLHHLTCGSLSSSPRWLVLNSCSARCHVGEAVKFLSLHAGVWGHMTNAWCPHWWLFLKTLQTKVRVIILTKS